MLYSTWNNSSKLWLWCEPRTDAGGEHGRAAPRARCPPGRGRGWRRQRSGGDGRTSSRAVLYACCKEAN